MPYVLNWEEKGVYKRFFGFVSFQEYARSQEMVLADARSDDIRWIINDLRDMEGYSITAEQAEYSAAYNYGSSLSNPKIRVAYVTSDLKLKLLIRMVGPFSALQVKDFSDLDEARRWALSP